MSTTASSDALTVMLRSLKLPTVLRHFEEMAGKAEKEGWTYGKYLHHLAELEVEERRRRRIERYQRESALLPGKTLSLNRTKLPMKVQKVLPSLCEGGFVERGENVLAFGLPGRGKTHLVCAIGHELIQRGYRVLSRRRTRWQRLLTAKRDLRLEKELAHLDTIDAVILDDIGYVQQSRDEMEVLFTFLAERYERRSVMITSNLMFSSWDRIFKDPMTAAAAIDRLVHHSTVLDVTGESVRAEEAKQAEQARKETETTTTPATTTTKSKRKT